MLADWRIWIDWLNKNSGAVTAAAAVAGVIVAVLYTVVTLLLWTAARRQAQSALRMFEGNHRPYVHLKFENVVEEEAGKSIAFDLTLENRGDVPADILDLTVRIFFVYRSAVAGPTGAVPVTKDEEFTFTKPLEKLTGLLLQPGAHHGVAGRAAAGPFASRGASIASHFHAKLDYRGVSERILRTTVDTSYEQGALGPHRLRMT